MNSQTNEQSSSEAQAEPTNRLRSDGFAALAIGLISAVLIFVMLKHFVS
jgi:hypothetical protein